MTIMAIPFTPSEEMLKREKYIEEKFDTNRHTGECWITYQEMKENKMEIRSPEGRGKFYTACHRLGIEYVNKPNYGYSLSSPKNASTIARNKSGRIGSAVKRTELALDNILDKHRDELPESQVETFEHTRLGCAAIRGQQRSMDKVIRKELPQLSAVTPMI